MTRSLLGMFLVGSLLLGGCVEDRSLAGEWVADVEISETPGGTEEDDFAGELAKTLSESMELSVNLNKDGTYVEQVLFFEVSGKWKIRGDELVLMPREINGTKVVDVTDANARKNLGQEKVFEISQDRTSFLRSNPEGNYSEVFRRKPSN